MTARIHPGAVRHLWDHYVATLRAPDGGRAALVSVYAVIASDTLGTGTVAVLDLAVPGGAPLCAVVADPLAIGHAMAGRLRSLSMVERALDCVVVSDIERVANPATGSVAWLIALGERSVEVTWLQPSPPFWLDAPAPTLAPDEDIWASFIEYADATVKVDGLPVAGRPFGDDAWVPKVGRPLSSAHVAYGEVRVDPEVDAGRLRTA